jgi:hypothetical protein
VSLTLQVRPVATGKPVPSYSTIVHYAHLLLKLLSFKYRPHFKVEPSDYQTVYHTLDKLHKEGHLIRGIWGERVRIGFYTVRQISRLWLGDAITEGTRSWDVRLVFACQLTLQYALGCRSGDVSQSKGYGKEECLLWRDVILIAPDGAQSINDFTCIIALRAVKGSKYNSPILYNHRKAPC